MHNETKLFIEETVRTFSSLKNDENANYMEAYMKHQAPFLGVKQPIRKEAQKKILSLMGHPKVEQLKELVQGLWELREREYQLFAIEILVRNKNKVPKEFIDLYEYLITNKPWWDTVDVIAYKLVGTITLKYPEIIDSHMEQWSTSEHLWLRRTSILYQLQYKDKMNTQLLTKYIKRAMGTKEFFLNKAIGWTLREYSKTDPEFVMDFVDNHPELSNLSKREALRLIKN